MTQHDDDHPLDLEADDERDDDDGAELGSQLAGLEGLPIGPPFALATDCSLLSPDPKKKIEGCVACIQCDACGQLFRISLLGSALHACPKCKLEYTSILIVATADDDQILGDAFKTVLRSNGLLGSDDDDDGHDDDDDDDQAHGNNNARANPGDE